MARGAAGLAPEWSPVLNTPAEVEAGSLLFLDLVDEAKICYDRDGFLARYLAGLKERFLSFVEESAELAARLRRSSAKGDIVKIKSFIESHYNEDISLKSIAARFYMNPVYLGQLFKKTYGIYFNDYLLQIRIDHAKRLLRQTEMRVYEIARSVGFDNADYFVCKFEKVEG
ncbi:MAG: helix-turn-helix domain-containing protein, partial [Anaerolineae bacterium]|nr:helix-turn-helix domain-containing protein [Anaerolineae bacterium]